MIKFKYAIGGDLSDSEASDIESDSTSDIETNCLSDLLYHSLTIKIE